MIDQLSITSNTSQLNSGDKVCQCKVCGYRNIQDVQSCLNCGVALEKACGNCGLSLPPGNKFCTQCGTPQSDHQAMGDSTHQNATVLGDLQALKPTTLINKLNAASGEILNEQRDVTLLCVKVVFTPLTADTFDEEDQHFLLKDLLSHLTNVVYKYEGAIDAFSNDGLVIFFGAPIIHEDDPERALRAAIEIQSISETWLSDLDQGADVKVHLHQGLHTGQVVAGQVGNGVHAQYTIVGQSTSLAKALSQAANPDTILVSNETYKRAQSYFEFKPERPLRISGLPDPLPIFQLLHLRETPQWGYHNGPMNIPMVGRGSDLAQLKARLTTLWETQQGQIALISGAAGLGKSRLVAEFIRDLNAIDTQIYKSVCSAFARSAPLAVVVDLLQTIIGISATDTLSYQLQALQAYLTRRNLAGPDVTPYLSHILGLNQTDPQLNDQLHRLDATVLQEQTHAALRQVFLAEAKCGPIILILEDLHWMDPASRDFLVMLIESTAEAPLMLVLVSRPIDQEPFHKSLVKAIEHQQDRFTVIRLQTLPDHDAQKLVDQLIYSDAFEVLRLKEQIVKRATGNPLYIEEIIRVLIDQNGLIRTAHHGCWQVTQDAYWLLEQVPKTIQGVILARLDQLPGSLRYLLQKAAVLGLAFPFHFLHQISEIETEQLTVCLTELTNRQFLQAKPFRSESGFVFQHTLIQETIYQALLKRDRRQIHAQIAQVIEASILWLPEEKAEALAFHYGRSIVPTKAIPHLLMAADNASRRCAYETAIGHYQQALLLHPDQPNDHDDAYFHIRIGLSRALKYTGAFDLASNYLSEALHLLWQWHSVTDATALCPILVECLLQMADIRQREGGYERALQYLNAGLQVLGTDGLKTHSTLWRSLLDRMAWIRFRQGQLREAAILANQAIAIIDPAKPDDPSRVAKLYNTLGGITWQQGQLEDAISHVERSLELYEGIGYMNGQAIAYGNLGILYGLLGNWPKAAQYYEKAYEIHLITGTPEGQANNLDNLGILHIGTGDHDSAQQNLEASLTIRQRLGDRFGIAQSQVNLAHLAFRQRRLTEAATCAEAALSLSRSIGASEIQVEAYWVTALIRAEVGEVAAGIQLAKEALQIAETTGLTEKETECLRVLGLLEARDGRFIEAETRLQDSLNLAIQQRALYRQGQAQLELGRVYKQLTHHHPSERLKWQSKAHDVLAQAYAQFVNLGASFDLQQTQVLLDRDIESI